MARLLEPIRIGTLELANRVAMPPMVRLAPHVDPLLLSGDGAVTPAIVEHYAARARAGVGLIVVEATCVDRGGRVWKHGLSAMDDSAVDGLTSLASAIAAEGSVPGIQLVHGGPQADPELCGGRIVGPSDVPASVGATEPEALTIRELLAVQASFVAAVERAARAGFRFIELHAAHGYLLDAFRSSRRNLRADAFGGNVANRMRMLVDTLLRARAAVGRSVLVGPRVSFFNHIPDGLDSAGFEETLTLIEQAGADFVDVSTDGVFKGCFGAVLSIGQAARKITRLPIIAAGGVQTAREAETAIADGHCDVVAVGRALLADAGWAAKARSELADA